MHSLIRLPYQVGTDARQPYTIGHIPYNSHELDHEVGVELVRSRILEQSLKLLHNR